MMAMNDHSDDPNKINGHKWMKRSRIRLPHVIISDEHKRLSRTYVQPNEKDVYFKHLGLKSIIISRKLRHKLTYDDTHTLSFRFADVEFGTKLVQQLEKRNLEFVSEPKYRPSRRVEIKKPNTRRLAKPVSLSEIDLKKKAIEDFKSWVVVVENMICFNCKEAFNDQHCCYSFESSSDSGISEMELKKKAIEDLDSWVVVVENTICNNCKEAFNDQHSCYSMETSSDSGISECGSNTMINAEKTRATSTINQMSSE